MLSNKMNTLPSLHLFCEGSLQKGPYNDVDYLKAFNELEVSLADTHFAPDVLSDAKVSSGDHEVLPHLDMFYDNLAKLDPARQSRVILFNTPAEKAGSSDHIIGFAKILSRSGNRIVMLDCNLRAVGSQSFFDLPSGIGVGDYVAGNVGLDMIINESGHKNIYFIKSGHSVGNSVRLLMSTKFNELIDRLKYEFDYILVNSPPYRDCIDAFVLAKFLRPIVLLLRSQRQGHHDDVSDVRAELGVLKLPVMELSCSLGFTTKTPLNMVVF